MENDKPNLKVLNCIAVNGVPMLVGRVFSKDLIATTGNWYDLVTMVPHPRLEETDEPVNDDLYDAETGSLLPPQPPTE
jgi:hypothetical protein